MTEFFHTAGMSYEAAWFTATIIGILLIALPLMLAVAMIIYADRKIWAAMALRRGPNVVGPFGLLQSFADGLKVFLQETIIPSASNKGLFLIAPIITFTVALLAWAVIPFSATAVLADINVGLLYILAISSLGVYGVVLSGWASNSKYPFFSAMRAAAQMISYEVSIGFILISVVLWAKTFNMLGIVEAQKGHVLGFINAFGLNPLLFPIAVMFLISAMAETARAPFDLTEAESELVAGYQTEYSSMSFALFWLGEYANVLLMCTLNAVLFWGGYLPPFDWAPLYYVPGIIWLFAKILFFFFIFSWVKATVPRYRYDQLMRLGWKIFLPISLFWVFLVSGYLMWKGHWNNTDHPAITAESMTAIGASDVCFLEAEENYGKPNEFALPVFLNRPLGYTQHKQVVEIKHPRKLAGQYSFQLDQTNGHGGTGRLTPLGQPRKDQIGLAVFDVIRADGRSNVMLQTVDQKNRSFVGDCKSAQQLKGKA